MTSKHRIVLAVVAVLAVLALLIMTALQTPLLAFWHAAGDPNILLLSGNIEAHESVLSFKTVQSRIVALPFNEGQWVSKETVLAVVDAADYQQQLAIAEANLAVQQGQLESARQNLYRPAARCWSTRLS